MSSPLYEIGSLVNVANRTWRGINKEGGVGRIIAINNIENTVDVKYVLTGTEKNIDLHYVEFHKFLQDDNDDKKDTTGRGRRRTSRRAKTVIDTNLEEKKKPLSGGKGVDSPVKKEEKSTSQQVNTVTPATSGKKVKKNKSARLSENDLDQLIQAINISSIPPVVTPAEKEKRKPNKSLSYPEPKDSPVTVAASTNDTTLKKNKKVQKKKLPVETKELSKVINAEMVDKTARFDGNITESVPKKQKTNKPENRYNQQRPVNKKSSLKLNNNHNESFPQVSPKNVKTNQSNNDDPSNTGNSDHVTKIKNGLEVIYRDNSKKAISFVNDIVGAPVLPMEKETPDTIVNETKKNPIKKLSKIEHPIEVNENQSKNVDKGEEELLKISAEEKRSILFDSLLSEIMTKRMLDEISISDMLKTINSLIVPPNKEFSDLELRSQLIRLEELNRIMVTWEDGIVYQI